MLKLHVIVVSTRPQRAGRSVADWFLARAQAHGKFDPVLVDLAEVALPLLDEPKHPRFQQYEHEHTRRWSESVRSADAFVFVTPEYNYSAPPTLINAVDYLLAEWAHKPAGFVSYGGVSGGTRAVQMAKQVLTAVNVMPIPQAVSIPFFSKLIGTDGKFVGGETQEKAAVAMLDELHRWAEALKPLHG
jgi:NAD(P)H-dependent FMN reductase